MVKLPCCLSLVDYLVSIEKTLHQNIYYFLFLPCPPQPSMSAINTWNQEDPICSICQQEKYMNQYVHLAIKQNCFALQMWFHLPDQYRDSPYYPIYPRSEEHTSELQSPMYL